MGETVQNIDMSMNQKINCKINLKKTTTYIRNTTQPFLKEQKQCYSVKDLAT